MPAASQSPPSQNRAEGRTPLPRVLADGAGAEPRLAFRTALSRYKGGRLAAIRLAQGTLRDGTRIRPVGNADEITEHLDQPAAVEALVARLETGSRLALSLFALTETTSISLAGLVHTLRILGAEPTGSIMKLLELGLLAIEPSAELGPVDDFRAVLERGNPTRLRLRAHPAVTNGVRTTRPDIAPPKLAGPVRQVRESDGLEPILRLGALWQRVGAEPLRQTHQGTLYKRDRDRLTEDPVLACSIADALKPLARLPELWLELARHVGLIERDPAGDRLLAASFEFWTDNAVHLPQMIATRWIGLQSWQELEATSAAANAADTALPFLRFAHPPAQMRPSSRGGHMVERPPPWQKAARCRSPLPAGARCHVRGRPARCLPRPHPDSAATSSPRPAPLPWALAATVRDDRPASWRKTGASAKPSTCHPPATATGTRSACPTSRGPV